MVPHVLYAVIEDKYPVVAALRTEGYVCDEDMRGSTVRQDIHHDIRKYEHQAENKPTAGYGTGHPVPQYQAELEK